MGIDKFAGSISIRCPNSNFKLQVDTNAFLTSTNRVTQVTITPCDLSELDLSFLSTFHNLTNLILSSNLNVHQALKTLPHPLPSLNTLNLYASRGMNEIFDFPILENGLTTVDVGGTSIDSSAASRILNWLIKSSADTLSTLYLDSNSLTALPPQITSLNKLIYLELSYNQIKTVRTGELRFNSAITNLYLRANLIENIQAGAFQGKIFHI